MAWPAAWPLIGFGAYGIAALAGGAAPIAVVAFAAASASGGFLLHNFPPARVFLGDAGSIPLGFLAGALGLAGAAAGAWPAWFPLLVFSPFIVDATLVVLRRLRRREPVWRAHRGHYYQRLVARGMVASPARAVGLRLMLAAAASALAGRALGTMLQCGIISAWVVAYALLLVAIERRLPRPAMAFAGLPSARPGKNKKSRNGAATFLHKTCRSSHATCPIRCSCPRRGGARRHRARARLPRGHAAARGERRSPRPVHRPARRLPGGGADPGRGQLPVRRLPGHLALHEPARHPAHRVLGDDGDRVHLGRAARARPGRRPSAIANTSSTRCS